ncbi:MAG: DUF6261 family protein [Dysgonamonadaceae bacterium]|jgi:hypothetical protein|nr:DUF6261 family protein [Dysgonamonadaceae bacterium]
MIKFHSLHAHNLTIVNLAGLSSETIIAGNAAGVALGQLGTAALNSLVEADSAFRAKLITARGSQITKEIHESDERRDLGFMEIWRTSSAASKSSISANAEAGKTLVAFLKPYRNVPKEPIMSETSTINYLEIRYHADMSLQNAASGLQLTSVFADLFSINRQISDLWNARANEDAEKSGPSPSSLRLALEKSYDSFCNVIVQTLRLQPSPALEILFSVMNEIRIKYSRSLPVKLTDANTSVDAIPAQEYTGKPVTPIPHVYFKTEDGKFSELLFTVDFFVTYRNNTEVGEAKVIIHGKGKYTGSHTSSFHIR